MIMRCVCFCCILLSSVPSGIQASPGEILTAAERGDIETVTRLIRQDPGLAAAVDSLGYSALHKAAYNNHPDVADYLLSQGADINAVSRSGSTPLHGAASYGHLDVVRFLLEKGAKPDVANAGGYTPLLGAAVSGHREIVRLLAERGADVNARLGDGRTALYLAVWNNDTDLAGFLVDRGAETNIATRVGVSLPFFATAYRDAALGRIFIDKAGDINERDGQGLTLLHFAAARGFADQAERLLARGADVRAKDSLGRTPLFYADLWGHAAMAELLRSHGVPAGDGDPAWFAGDFLGQPLPGKIPAAFAGDKLRTPFAPHGKLTFSPDGNELFWCHHAMPIQAVWYSRKVDGVWAQPILAPFTDPALDYADGHPSFSADGSRIYFHSQRPIHPGEPRKEKSDIWYVQRTPDGWGEPVAVGVPINTDESEYGPMITPSGNLYFVAETYTDSHGAGDIYVSELVNGEYTAPRNLGPAINSEFNELTPAVSPDESYMIFASNRPFAHRNNVRLYISFRNGGAWTKAIPLFAGAGQDNMWHPFITHDGKFTFYQQGTGYFWFRTALIEDIRTALLGPGRSGAQARTPVLRKNDQVFEHAATNEIALGDLDDDGDLDAVFSNMRFIDSRVYLNDGRGRLTATEQRLTQQGHGVALGDLDGDGDLDIFITCAGYNEGQGTSDRPSRVYFNDGSAHFTVSPQDLGDSLLSGNAIELHDIDGDDDLDAMVVYYEQANGVYLNDGKGGFTRSESTFPNGAVWGDLNGDSVVDIFCREDGVGFKTLLNDGRGHFAETWSRSDSSVTRDGVGLGDIDGDGDCDAVVAFPDKSERRFSTVWYNDGSGRFSESDVRLPLTRFGRLTIGDLNVDGKADVFVGNFFGFPCAVWLNDGRGGLIDSGIRLPGEGMTGKNALGDLDGDGDLDICIAAFGGGPNEVWFIE